jgi:hypothetical protein
MEDRFSADTLRLCLPLLLQMTPIHWHKSVLVSHEASASADCRLSPALNASSASWSVSFLLGNA